MSTPTIQRARVLIARQVFDETVERLSRHFDVHHNQADARWTQAELIQRLQGMDGLFITGGESIDARLLQACPQLRAVCSMAVGYNNIDLPACTARGVLVSNAPGVLTETTADLGFALMLAAARRISEGERFLRDGQWQRWSHDMFAGADVHGSTLGVLGMGRIGQAIARRGALGFGMRVIYHNRTRLPEAVEQAVGGARLVGKEELLQSADHVMLVLPLTPETRHLIGAAELALMKPTATLVNIGRGGVVDDAALAVALREGRIAAAGLDVFEGEPRVHPELLACSNVALTPHIASATVPTRRAMANLAADNLISYLTEGRASTALNPEVIGRRAAR